MSTTLDITPLRSFVAIASSGGFHRAAATLHLTQSAVSQHVRRLEQATGRTLVERSGRQARFTADGEELLVEARKILGAHDSAARMFEQPRARTVSIGATEHASEIMLPEVSRAVRRMAPGLQVRFRLDRTQHVLTALETGAIDLGIVIEVAEPPARDCSALRLQWCAAISWTRTAGEPLQLAVFDAPCMLRQPLFAALESARIPYRIAAECGDLAGYQAAVRAGLGLGLLPTLGRLPDGIRPVEGLPDLPPVRMSVLSAPGAPKPVQRTVTRAVRVAMKG